LSSTPNESEKREAAPVNISVLDLYQLLELFVMLLNEQAWRYMGLRVDPRTNEIKEDFERAHIAIECIISLVDKLEPKLIGDAKNRLRSQITDLQINYARQINKKGK
jgi:hypothetical protein